MRKKKKVAAIDCKKREKKGKGVNMRKKRRAHVMDWKRRLMALMLKEMKEFADDAEWLELQIEKDGLHIDYLEMRLESYIKKLVLQEREHSNGVEKLKGRIKELEEQAEEDEKDIYYLENEIMGYEEGLDNCRDYYDCGLARQIIYENGVNRKKGRGHLGKGAFRWGT